MEPKSISTGLVSVTFRKLSPQEIIDIAVQAGLDIIEWGGDIHVPLGNLKVAREVRSMTEDSGLASSCYGSYFRVGASDLSSFTDCLATTVQLNAPVIRVWAGGKRSNDMDQFESAQIHSQLKTICKMSAGGGIKIAVEFHLDTFADNVKSVCELIRSIDEPNLLTHWQPLDSSDVNRGLSEISEMSKYLSHVHCFHWKRYERCPLEDGKAQWLRYLKELISARPSLKVLLEFVKDDDIDQFLRDSATLKSWLKELTASAN